MTKAELIEKMAKEADISKVAAGKALDSFVDGVTKTLKKKDGKVTLVGFGTFQKSRRKARKGRNPQTGEMLKNQGPQRRQIQAWKETKRRGLKKAANGVDTAPLKAVTSLTQREALPFFISPFPATGSGSGFIGSRALRFLRSLNRCRLESYLHFLRDDTVDGDSQRQVDVTT